MGMYSWFFKRNAAQATLLPPNTNLMLSLQEIAISYNGGKDCLVMLILLMATIHKKFSSSEMNNPSVNILPPDYKLDSI